MKKSMIRFLSLALCLVMILGLAACDNIAQDGAKPQSTPASQNTSEGASQTDAPVEYAWKSEFLSLKTDEEDSTIQPVIFTDGGFYATGSVKLGRQEVPEGQVEEYEGQYDIYGTALYFVSLDGKVTKLPNYVPSEPLKNTEGKKDFYSYCNLGRPILNSEGKLVLLEQQAAGWFDGPDSI